MCDLCEAEEGGGGCVSAGFGAVRCQYADTAPQYVEAVLEWWEEAHVRGLHDAIETQVRWVTQTRDGQQRQQKPASAGGQNMGLRDSTSRRVWDRTRRWALNVDDGKVERRGGWKILGTVFHGYGNWGVSNQNH